MVECVFEPGGVVADGPALDVAQHAPDVEAGQGPDGSDAQKMQISLANAPRRRPLCQESWPLALYSAREMDIAADPGA